MGRQPLANKIFNLIFEGVAHVDIFLEDDKGLNNLRPYRIRFSDDRGHGHGRVPDQTVFDFAGANAISGTGDQIILSTHEPEISVFVLSADVSGEAPVADKLLFGGIRISPVFEKHHRIGPSGRNVARGIRWQDFSGIIDNLDDKTGNGPSHGAGPDRHDFGAIAHHQVKFGLAVELIDLHLQRPFPPFE